MMGKYSFENFGWISVHVQSFLLAMALPFQKLLFDLPQTLVCHITMFSQRFIQQRLAITWHVWNVLVFVLLIMKQISCSNRVSRCQTVQLVLIDKMPKSVIRACIDVENV